MKILKWKRKWEVKLKVRSQKKKKPLEVKKESGKWNIIVGSEKKSRMWKKFELKKGFEVKWIGSIKKRCKSRKKCGTKYYSWQK